MAELTFYPVVGANSPVDGRVGRNGGATNEAFATIKAGAGNVAVATDASQYLILRSTATTDQYSELSRFIYCFDTSAIANGTVTAATLSIYGISKFSGLGEPDLHIVASNPASTSTLANSDYGNVSFTSFGSVANGSFNTSGYNDVTLNASGLANISTSGVSKFGAVLSWDVSGAPTWASATTSYLEMYFADQTGTDKDPKLVVTYTPAPVSGFIYMSV